MKVTYVGQNEENLEPRSAVHQLFYMGARKGILLACALARDHKKAKPAAPSAYSDAKLSVCPLCYCWKPRQHAESICYPQTLWPAHNVEFKSTDECGEAFDLNLYISPRVHGQPYVMFCVCFPQLPMFSTDDRTLISFRVIVMWMLIRNPPEWSVSDNIHSSKKYWRSKFRIRSLLFGGKYC